MAEMNLHKAEFRKSVVSRKDFMMDKPSIVFAGKSNVGKSSVINKLLNRKNFARVGNTPGKTVHINYFDIDGKVEEGLVFETDIMLEGIDASFERPITFYGSSNGGSENVDVWCFAIKLCANPVKTQGGT